MSRVSITPTLSNYSSYSHIFYYTEFSRFLQDEYLFKESIGNNRFLTAGMFNGAIMVHIREYEEGDGKLFPTRKGASFTEVRWARFIRMVDEIERHVDLLKAGQCVELHLHIGGAYYATISKGFKCVDIRRYFIPKDTTKEIPSRIGIALRIPEFENLLVKIREIQEKIPALKLLKPCYSRDDHANQQGYIECIECNPFGLDREYLSV